MCLVSSESYTSNETNHPVTLEGYSLKTTPHFKDVHKRGVFEFVSPKENHEKLLQFLEQHHKSFSESNPLIASENVPSPAVREAVISDFGNRYAE